MERYNVMATKELPILFNGDMVRAILAGDKTQTRRPVKPQSNEAWAEDAHVYEGKWASGECVSELKSPFGKAGDVLWVRETFRVDAYGPYADAYGAYLDYASDNARVFIETDKSLENKLDKLYRKSTSASGGVSTFIPSIHMPKVACRIKLKVKRVWVERVQDITWLDAQKEGIYTSGGLYRNGTGKGFGDPTNAFAVLWNSIYGTWSDNPWVWACEFEIVK